MKFYNVEIEAEDQNGKKIIFAEVVKYDLDPRSPLSCVRESVREAKAVEQVRMRMPHLTNIKALSSISP